MADEPIQGTFVSAPIEWEPAEARYAGAARPRATTPLPDPPAPAVIAPRPAPSPFNRLGLGLLAVGLLLGVLVGGLGGGVAALLLARTTSASPVAAPLPIPGVQVTQQTANASAIYRRVAGAVVAVGVTFNNTGRFDGGEGEGTGIVIDEQGYILTNNHVVANSNEVRIRMIDGTILTASVVANAPQDDLALLKADIPADKLVVAPLGTSAGLEPGQPVVAIGNPFGLDHTMTAGIISAINRDWSPPQGRTMRGMIQTDAPINPGNSGGPLLNEAGQVIGINTAIESPVGASVGIGFAIPIDRAKDLLPQLRTGQQVARPWLGIRGGEITARLAEQLGLNVEKGVLVTEVVPDSPAQKAGLRGVDVTEATTGNYGDIITAVDGKAIGSVADITGYLDSKKVGDTVTVTVLREGESLDLQVTLEAWRDTP
jgi:putative serine protease PepD